MHVLKNMHANHGSAKLDCNDAFQDMSNSFRANDPRKIREIVEKTPPLSSRKPRYFSWLIFFQYMFDTCCKILQFRGSGKYKLGTSVFPVHVGEEEVFAEVIAALKETFSYKKLPLCQKGFSWG